MLIKGTLANNKSCKKHDRNLRKHIGANGLTNIIRLMNSVSAVTKRLLYRLSIMMYMMNDHLLRR